MRDHTKLKAFQLGEELAVETYKATSTFPKEEMFGLCAQMRRAAVSIASNIVEGSARSSHGEYLRFLEIAYGSSRELQFQVHLASRLQLLHSPQLESDCVELSKVLNALIRALKNS